MKEVIINNIRESCSQTKCLKHNNEYLPGLFVELIYDTETHNIRTIQHTNRQSRAVLGDSEVSVNIYSRPATMKEIRHDVELAVYDSEHGIY